MPRSRKSVAVISLLVLSALLGGSSLAAVPSTVDSYGGNAFADGVHIVIGSNNDPNFEKGAIGNRYPLAEAGQDISPASAATASIDDYGPLVSTVAGTDCNNGTPPANYCLEFVRTEAPYARAQFPNPPGKGTDHVNGPHDSGTGTADAHAEELKANADGAYTGSPGPVQTISNSTAHSETSVAASGQITVKTHSHVGSACFGVCGTVNYVTVTNTDVVTSVTAINGKATPSATVSPGQVQYCATAATCQPIAVDNNGITVGPAGQSVPVPGLGGAGEATFFRIRTVTPQKSTTGGTGSVDALGLDIQAKQPGNAAAGIPDTQVEYILGEGHADGFSAAPLALGGFDLSNGGNSGSGPVTAALNDVTGSGAGGGSSAGGSGSSPVKKATGAAGSGRSASTLAGALRPPFILWFYLWEASALAGAVAIVWSRRRRLREMREEA
ncbi:MAG: hypothetical protein WBD38_03450 [Candidatus Dormiibacterota bacterium]